MLVESRQNLKQSLIKDMMKGVTAKDETVVQKQKKKGL